MESVWDFPRPPAVVRCARRVRVEHEGAVLAESDRALRVLETSHPPAIYLPPGDVRLDLLTPSATARATVCEFKGVAEYLDDAAGTTIGWTYRAPAAGYEALRDHVALYPGRVTAAWLGDERVTAQEGDFYGGWITKDIVGPFKGPPGTRGW